MKHYYLNKLGIKSDDCCIFNTTDKKVGKNFFKYKKEKAQHGFDSRETWALDYTSATWLYEHLCFYKEVANKIIDLNYHHIKIPVLHIKEENTITEEIENKTQLEAIDLIITYLKYYLSKQAETIEQEHLQYKYLQTAFKIYAEIITSMWW